MKFRKALVISGFVLPFSFIYAAGNSAPIELQKSSVFESVSYVPKVYLSGYGGTTLMGQVDVLAPMYFTNRNIFFAYLQSRMSNTHDSEDSWGDEDPRSASLGFGYREIVDDDFLLGVYGFGDYSHTSTGHDVYVLSPGVEELGKVWDARINGYFPLGDKSWESGDWADKYNDYRWNYFTGHSQYDHFYVFKEETGNGGDVEIGRKLFKSKGVLVKGYIGGYYYNMEDNDNITGGSFKLSAQPNKILTITAQDTYDGTYHNVFMVGVKIKLNEIAKMNKEDISVDENDLSQRLVDSIDRNLIANGNGSIVPTNFSGPYDKGQGLEHDNLWFFEPASENEIVGAAAADSQQNGTAENPFIGFTQDNYNAINPNIGTIDPNPLLFFAPGSYSFSSFGSEDRFALPDGWGMYGRTNDYMAPATGDDRAEFNGGLDLVYEEGEGTEATTLNSIRITNTGSPLDYTDAALYAQNADNVILQNIDFESSLVGVYADKSTINFDSGENTIVGYQTSTTDPHSADSNVSNLADITGSSNNITYGIYATNSSTMNFNGGTNNVSATITSPSTTGNNFTYGVYASNSSTVNLNSGTNNISASTISASNNGNDYTYGIYTDASAINFYNGANNVSAATTSASNTVFDYNFGINASNYSTVNFNGGINNISSYTSGTTGSHTDLTYSLATTKSTINLSGGRNDFYSIILNPQTGANYTTGIYGDSSYINFNGGTNNIFSYCSVSGTGVTNTNYGLWANNNSVISFNSGKNSITAFNHISGTGNTNSAYGIYDVNHAAVNFANSTDDKVNIIVLGNDTQYGIYADAGSHIQRNGSDLAADTPLSEIQEYLTLIGAGNGAAVYWQGSGANPYIDIPWLLEDL